jgi:hypothetical protein
LEHTLITSDEGDEGQTESSAPDRVDGSLVRFDGASADLRVEVVSLKGRKGKSAMWLKGKDVETHLDHGDVLKECLDHRVVDAGREVLVEVAGHGAADLER